MESILTANVNSDSRKKYIIFKSNSNTITLYKDADLELLCEFIKGYNIHVRDHKTYEINSNRYTINFTDDSLVLIDKDENVKIELKYSNADMNDVYNCLKSIL